MLFGEIATILRANGYKVSRGTGFEYPNIIARRGDQRLVLNQSEAEELTKQVKSSQEPA